MDDRALLDAMWSNTALIRALGHSGRGAHLVERGGVVAAVVPVCPERSVVNSVYFAEPAGLAAAYDGLARAYDAAGIEAWTVWVPEQDRETAAFLESRGPVLDAAPTGMGAPLDEVTPSSPARAPSSAPSAAYRPMPLTGIRRCWRVRPYAASSCSTTKATPRWTSWQRFPRRAVVAWPVPS